MRIGTIVLGIIVASIDQVSSDTGTYPLLPEPSFYYSISIAAEQLGLDLYVFTAADYDAQRQLLYGYRLKEKRWTKQQVPWPDIVYDRCFFTNSVNRSLHRSVLADMKAHKPYQLLNSRLPSKLHVYDALRSDDKLSQYLPATFEYRSHKQLEQLADQYNAGVILKPAAGMQGKGVLHVKRCLQAHSLLVAGNIRQKNSLLEFTNLAELEQWLKRFMKRSPFILQPYLPLSDASGKPFDIRALLQKDRSGRWKLTGTAVRIGHVGSITSNLHSGGLASPTSELLIAKYGKPEAERLLHEIHTISGRTANRLEHSFGRFGELAFDYGVEPSGKLWLIEANSKPGRTAFQHINDSAAQQRSIERLLHYALFLYNRFEKPQHRYRYLNLNNGLRPFNVQEVHR